MKKLNWPLYIIILINLIFFTFCYAQKKDFLVDEIYSFGQANSATGAYIFPEVSSNFANLEKNLNNHWLDPSLFQNYVSVQEGEEFNYLQVAKNLSQGVHPPLFHMMLHTVSSFFPNRFNIWLGYVLNLPILALLLVFVYRLAYELFAQDKKMAYLALVFCGFSLSVLNMAVFIRMYLLWMCLFVALLYFTMKYVEQNQTSFKKISKIFLLAFLCFLTHMYSLVYVFFLSASTCLWLAYQKRWRQSFFFGGAVLLALLSAYICFPTLFQIAFHSVRGVEFQNTAANLNLNIFDVVDKFDRFFVLFFAEILNFPFFKTEYFLIFFILAVFWGTMQHIHKSKMLPYAWWIFSFALPIIIFLSFFSPYMGIYDERYFAPILVVVTLLIFYWLNYFLKTLFLNKRKRVMILSLLIAFNLCFLNFYQRSDYLLQNSKISDFQNMVKNQPVVAWDYCNFNLLYLLSSAQKFYIFLAPDKFSPKELDKAKGSLFFVSSAFFGWQKYNKINQTPIPYDWKKELDLIGTYQIGICLYDVYRIKK